MCYFINANTRSPITIFAIAFRRGSCTKKTIVLNIIKRQHNDLHNHHNLTKYIQVWNMNEYTMNRLNQHFYHSWCKLFIKRTDIAVVANEYHVRLNRGDELWITILITDLLFSNNPCIIRKDRFVFKAHLLGGNVTLKGREYHRSSTLSLQLCYSRS